MDVAMGSLSGSEVIQPSALIAVHAKTDQLKIKVIKTFIRICLVFDSKTIPYPENQDQVIPFFKHVFKQYVIEENVNALTDRIRALATLIMTLIVKEVDVPGTTLKSMLDVLGVKNTVNFISIIEFAAFNKLEEDLEKEFPGMIDQFMGEQLLTPS